MSLNLPPFFINTADDFFHICPTGRLVALDVGAKTVGLARSDVQRHYAHPLFTFQRKKWSADGPILTQILKDNEATGLVVGWPLNMQGTQGPRCQATWDFMKNLWQSVLIPTLFWDERLSTQAAARVLHEAQKPSKKHKGLIDHIAAGFILQGALGAFAHFKQLRA